MSNDVKAILQNIRDKQFFNVEVELDGPIQFRGIIPFDMTIVGDVATFRVLASSFDEAVQQVDRFLGQ